MIYLEMDGAICAAIPVPLALSLNFYVEITVTMCLYLILCDVSRMNL